MTRLGCMLTGIAGMTGLLYYGAINTFFPMHTEDGDFFLVSKMSNNDAVAHTAISVVIHIVYPKLETDPPYTFCHTKRIDEWQYFDNETQWIEHLGFINTLIPHHHPRFSQDTPGAVSTGMAAVKASRGYESWFYC